MNRTTTILAVAIATALLAGAADAKRLGGGKTTSTATPSAKPAAAAPAAPAAAAPASPAPAPSATKKVVAAAAVGAAAGVVAGAAMAGSPPSSAAANDASAQQGSAAPMQAAAGTPGSSRIDATEARLRKMDSDATKPKDATPVKTAAERRREKVEADKKAAAEAAAELKRVKLAREMSCQIKPVMTDAEIANCREVWR
jgi:hypothetical protein